MTSDLVQDVENAMRQERIERYWKEYGPYIIGGAVLAVLITGAMAGYRGWAAKAEQRGTDAMLTALDTKDKVAALDKATPALRPGQKAVANLTSAGLLLRDGKKEEALAHYRATAADKALPSEFRSLAAWLSVRLDWSLHKDKAKIPELLAQLQPLIDDKSNPWTWHARIEAAGIKAHGQGDYAGARALLAETIAAESAPQSLKIRAEALAHVYKSRQPETDAKDAPTKKDQAG